MPPEVYIDPGPGLIAVLALILLHALFVAAEFGLVAIDRNRVEKMADEGSRRARSTLLALKSLSFQLSGAQLGITITSLLVGFLSSSLGVSVVVALIAATIFEMVAAELVPKNLAIARPLPIALTTVTPLRLFNRVLKFFIHFLDSSANRLVRLFGIEPKEEISGAYSLEELQILIRSSREGGGLDEEEFRLLARSIAFRDKSASEILVPRTSLKGLLVTATIAELMTLALETGHSRFPVYTDDLDDIVGVAYVKDGYSVPQEQRAAVRVTHIMRDMLVVPEQRKLDALLAEMRRDRQQLTVVVDEYGGTAGIITLEDLLEEIVGEIEDEYDEVDPGTDREQPEGVFVVSGMLHEDEVRDQTGFDMPDGDYETLAGFLLTLFDRIPQVGDQVAYEDWEFKVVEMEDKRISKVLMVAPKSTTEAES